MKTIKIMVACIFAATISVLKVQGQDTVVLKVLEENAPKYFNAPGMPRFSVIGKEQEFYLGIGGYIRGTMSYDLGNPIESPMYFITSAIPMDNPSGNSSLFQMSAASSNIFFNFVALPQTQDKVGAYVDFGFGEGMKSYGFSLKAAYLTYRNWIVGYTTSLFTDGAAAAQTIDQQGPNAMTFLFNTVVDYQAALSKHWKVGIGAEYPSVSATYGENGRGVNQRLPDIPLYVQYSWKDGTGWLRFSALMRNMYYYNETAGKDSHETGLGFKLSGASPFGKKFTLFSQSVYGRGIASYVQDLQGLGMDMVPVEGGGLKGVDIVGSYIGLQYRINEKISTSATFSEVKCFMPDDAVDIGGDVYKNAVYFVSNVIYRVSPVLTTGIEYLWGSRRNIDDTFRQDNRIQMSLRVNF
ncbi:MAG: hypothetical protein IKB48_02355 [Bacteroidales bacterium]|nr:hypothetical protein [Bacteroidales bacterium]